MRGFLFLGVLMAALIPGRVQGAVPEDTLKVERLDSVIVSTSRAGRSTPVAYTMVSKEDLRRTNPINSLPMTLSLQPSVVSVNEGGTGIGYSKLTVRGSKGSQINVTLNGITLNDAESQEVFWVNIPSLSNILSSVQLQRGLGTSANGAGAFGASINMSTASVGPDPYARFDAAVGSYNTFLATVAAGTGKGPSGLYFDLVYSRNYTDGYIRNAFAKVQSLYSVLGWMNEKNSLKLTYLLGDQHSGITWNGISLSQYEEDRRYNSAGEYTDAYGNLRYYDNETDNYRQHHLQLNYTRQFTDALLWTTTFNYTRGDGYYENYKADRSSTKYGFDEKFYGDFIIREAMANDYFVINSDLRFRRDRLSLTGGINLSSYDGDHFGKLLWSDVLGTESGYDYDSHYWYLNRGLKREANAFLRGEFTPLPWMTAYADLQYRGVSLLMSGEEDDGGLLDYKNTWNFFNPRAGLNFQWGKGHRAYLSAALGHREPGRSDIKEVIISRNWGDDKADLKPEKMVDIELGYTWSGAKGAFSANIYLMEYWDMLLETGKLSDVGYAIKENVGRSYRRGIELAGAWTPLTWLQVDANATLSTNKITHFIGYFDRIDSDWNYLDGQERIDFGETDILMSPSLIGMLQFTFRPFKQTTISLNGKYVGEQYIDNTSSSERMIPDYFVANLSATHTFHIGEGTLEASVFVNNLLNHLYYADGWTYNVYDCDKQMIIADLGIFPQAPANFMVKLAYRF